MSRNCFVKIVTVCFLCFGAMTELQAQLDKRTWLVGGTASLSFSKRGSPNYDNEKQTNIVIRPDIGYFFADKFAAGVRAGYSSTLVRLDEGTNKYREIPLGVFGRFYFLPADNPYNLLFDFGYSHIINYGGGSFGGPASEIDLTRTSKNAYSVAAGPVIYFTSSVGMEFLVEYMHSRGKDASIKENLIQFAVGFQVHLTPLD